jgi:hypothetical protein
MFRKPVFIHELQPDRRKLAIGRDQVEADLFEGLFLLAGQEMLKISG